MTFILKDLKNLYSVLKNLCKQYTHKSSPRFKPLQSLGLNLNITSMERPSLATLEEQAQFLHRHYYGH